MLRSIFIFLLLTIVSFVGRRAYAQDPPSKQADSKSDLTEGLMDLLREPAKEKNKQPLNGQPAIQPKTANPNNQPNFDGEDIGKGTGHPLADIQLEMSTLANWLRGTSDVSRTKELQRNVVLRLDEMIEQLEKQAPSPNQFCQRHHRRTLLRSSNHLLVLTRTLNLQMVNKCSLRNALCQTTRHRQRQTPMNGQTLRPTV